MPVIPDELAREYLLVALGVGRLEDGIVDAYHGPTELRTEAERRAAGAAQLAEQAAALRPRAADDPDPLRALWLDRQLLALEMIARRLAGDELPYLDEVERCFDARPERTDDDVYRQAHARLDALLPAGESLYARSEARAERLTVPPDRLAAVVAWLLEELRGTCRAHFPIPDGESCEVSLVAGEPWSAYNWYDGGLRSRIEINTDLPTRAHGLIALLTHETFPGHHLEHAWKEARLVDELGRAEATIQLINTPEAYISEGLAEIGGRLIIDRERWQELFSGICHRAGIELGPTDAAREWEITDAQRGLRATSADAALLLHVEGRPATAVRDFLEQQGLRSRESAEKGLQFISHPLWRTYVFCYSGGEKLLERWLESAGSPSAQERRFLRLLTEQLTPSGISGELAGN